MSNIDPVSEIPLPQAKPACCISIIPEDEQPVQLSIDWTNKFVIVRFHGDVAGTVVLACLNHFLENNETVVGMNCIVDLRTACLNGLTATIMIEISHLVEYWLRGHGAADVKIAIVAATQNNKQKALFYRQMTNADVQHVCIFPTIEDATAWVGDAPS